MWHPYAPDSTHGRLRLGPLTLIYAGAWWWALGAAIVRVTPGRA